MSVPGVWAADEFFSYESLKREAPASLSNAYLSETLAFCYSWLNGLPEMIIKTSGSTGIPKEISLTRHQLTYSAMATRMALQLTPADHALVCLDTRYIGGKMMLIRCMEIGMNMEIKPPSSMPLGGMLKVQPDFVALAPIQMQAMLDAELDFRINACRVILIGGAPVSPSLLEQIKSLTPEVYLSYGMTETASHIALRDLKSDSLAYALLPEVRHKLDERGCLMIQAPQTGGAWITTNDLVELLPNRRFFWLGRADQVINSGGLKIQVGELEQTIGERLLELGYEMEYFVTGIPDAKLGQRVILILQADLSKGELAKIQKDLRNHLPRYHSPKDYYQLEEFVLSGSGKVLRKETLDRLTIS